MHNPTGITTSQAHRRQLLQLAESYDCVILEDNAYEGLNFELVPAPIKALDRKDIVTYVGTFSKTIMPGIRVGYLVVTGQHYQPLVERKLLSDIHVSTVSQAIVSEYLASGHYRHHLAHLQTQHLQSRNAMLSALQRYFPPQHLGLFQMVGHFSGYKCQQVYPYRKSASKLYQEGFLLLRERPFSQDSKAILLSA